jgi:hypothetical protein
MKFLLAFLLAFTIGLSTVGGGDVHIVGQDDADPRLDIKPIEAALVVKIPAECEVGELVRMDATESKVDGITWRIMPPTEDFVIVDEGRRAFFSSRSGGEFLIIVAGARDGSPFLYVQTLTVEGSPIPTTGLALKVDAWMKKAPNGDITKLPAMADVFRRLATSDTSIDDMQKATALANSAVIGEAVAGLAPFLDEIGHELDRLEQDGSLDTREDYKRVWLELAAALDFVGKKGKAK